jgi:hypothetical protein
MNFWDILILLAVAAAIVLALLRIRGQKKSGKGCCGTSACSGHCENCGFTCKK